MSYIEIKNLIINDIKINLELLDKEIVGIYALKKHQKIVNELLFIISGINKGRGSCKYLGKDVFDNSLYFKKRIFLDFSLTYTNTLKKEFISENFMNRFAMEFKEDNFKKLIKELKIRQETTFDVDYKFSEVGNTLVNFAILDSIEKENIIISNPTYKVDDERVATIVKGLTNKYRYNNVLLNIDSISNFNGYLDKVLFFTKNNEILLVPTSETLLVIEDNIYLRNVICKGTSNTVISLNDYSKEELKEFDKKKLKYKVISIYDIDKYRGEDDE